MAAPESQMPACRVNLPFWLTKCWRFFPLSLRVAGQDGTMRSCGSCTLCCKVYEVPPVDNKPAGIWCKHCKPGAGCAIWQDRPQFCRDFQCMWILDERLGPEWKPETARFVMSYTPDQHMLGIRVDPGAPHAWKREPYLGGLHRWAKALAERNHFVMVNVGETGFLIMPERIVELGNIRHASM